MRKEIIGIFFFFLVILTIISFLSYTPLDPSINNSGGTAGIHNLFGIFGAHLAGFFIGLFGLGAFWLPILLLLASIYFFGDRDGKIVKPLVLGGFLLIISTGSLLSVFKHDYVFLGNRFSAGGLIGIPLKAFLLKYSNITGCLIILTVAWLIGFILTTGFSLIAFSRRCHQTLKKLRETFTTFLLKWKERRAKAKKRSAQLKQKEVKKGPKIKTKDLSSRQQKRLPPPKQELFEFMHNKKRFKLPPYDLLEDSDVRQRPADIKNLQMQSRLLEKKLQDFSIEGSVESVIPGPVITTFEYKPAPGVKINKIVNLSDDLSLALRATSIRIVAPIPGKAVIGIEISNSEREMVLFKEIVTSQAFENSKAKTTLCLGKDIVGNPVVAELNKMPHLLIAGATGTGKSVALNTMICSFLYKAGPDEVKMIMIDPKRIELSMYNGIPHLITPVVTDVKKATNALFWAVKEMETRYELLAEMKTRNIDQYNKKVEKGVFPKASEKIYEKFPYLVIIIDELADLMMVASRDVEMALMRLAQMARAAGIHLILATQRPSVDVLTGVIKANFPTRLTFQVSSKTDSRTIIDSNGAENLLGNGDMLFLPPGTAKLSRIHGAYISEEEITEITKFLKDQKPPEYNKEVIAVAEEKKQDKDKEDYDERYDDAVALVTKTRQASISMLQRHLRIGYNRSARIVEMMEKEGIVGPSDGARPREVLARGYD